MSKSGFTAKSFAFLKGLEENNNREWYTDHKPEFEAHVREPFLDLLEDLTARLADAPIPLMGNPKTTFRMNRDVRFSKNKAPYKTNMGAVLTGSGTKNDGGGFLYVHMDPKGGFTATGWYKLEPKSLAPFRQAMIDDADGFDTVQAALKKAGRALSTEDTLTTMPRGLTEHAEHRHADAIKLKSLILTEPLTKKDFTSGAVADKVEALGRDAMPFLAWGRAAKGFG